MNRPISSLPVAPMFDPRAFVPSDQIQRFGPGQALHMVHYDTPLHGTGQLLGAETQLFASPLRVGNDDLCSLKEAGRFSDFKQFVCFGIGIQCFFDQMAAPGVGEPTAEELYDLLVYYSRIQIQYQDSLKQALWTDQLPAGGGVYGFSQTASSFHLTNGVPSTACMFRFKEPLVITPQKTFRCTLKWQSSLVNAGPAPQPDPLTAFNSAINSAKYVRINLHGIEVRDVTNG